MLDHEHEATPPTELTSFEVLMAAKRDGSVEETVQYLMELLGQTDRFAEQLGVSPDELPEMLQILTQDHHEHYVAYRFGHEFPASRTRHRELAEATRQFEGEPILQTAQKMVNLYPDERNRTTEGVVRFLFQAIASQPE